MSQSTKKVTIPTGISVFKDGGKLRITRKWFSYKTIVGTIILIVVPLLVIYLFNWGPSPYKELFSHMYSLSQGAGYFFMPIQIAIFLAILYYTIAGYVNSTFIEIDADTLSIYHRPMPFWGESKTPSSALEQVYCTKFTNRGDVTYNVRAVTTNLGDVKLLSNLDSYEQAKFIKRVIENHLGIANVIQKASPSDIQLQITKRIYPKKNSK